MVKSCCSIGCTNRFQKGSGIGFFTFPSNMTKKDLWIRAVKRKNWVPSKSTVICGAHFQTGRPNSDLNHPDYVPNVFSFNTFHKGNACIYEKRKKNIDRRSNSEASVKRRKTSGKEVSTQILEDNAPPLVSDDCHSESPGNFSFGISQVSEISHTSGNLDDAHTVSTQVLEDNTPPHVSENCNWESPGNFSFDVSQISHTSGNLDDDLGTAKEKIKILELEKIALRKELGGIDIAMEMQVLQEENRCLKFKLEDQNPTLKILMNAKILKYYTSIANIETFNWILAVNKDYIKSNFKINHDTQLLIVLIKLRLCIENKDLAIRFNLSVSTISRIIANWLPVLAGRLQYLIFFPSHDTIRESLPECFKVGEYIDTVCILDCIEIFTQRPPNLQNKNLILSNYKHHQTIKFLVGIIPNGLICFISEDWDGRVSDKEITLESGIMNNFRPGDIVLADPSFNMRDHFAVHGIRSILPTFTKGKNQLTRQESNIRIHVERVIGYLNCFKILKHIMPISFVKYANHAITICAALINLSDSIMN